MYKYLYLSIYVSVYIYIFLYIKKIQSLLQDKAHLICERADFLLGLDKHDRFPTPSLNPQPSTLNPQPSTLNPKPETLHPKPSTLNPTP